MRRTVDVLLWVFALTVTLATVVLSLVPQETLEPVKLSDKVLHAGAYGAITIGYLLAAVWRPGRGDGHLPHGAGLIVGSVVGLGVLIELIQRVAGRSPDVRDALADALGVAIAWAVWFALRWHFERSGRTVEG